MRSINSEHVALQQRLGFQCRGVRSGHER